MFKPFNYKDRPDLTPDSPKRKGFFLFWELYIRKFWRLVSVNMLYFAFTLPMLVWCQYFLSVLLGSVDTALSILPGVGYITALLSVIPNNVFMVLLVVSILCYGPATMGATYIYRNFAREEHAWVSDFFTRAWRNLFQGIVFGLLDIFITLSLLLTAIGGVATIGGESLFAAGPVVKTLARVGLVLWLMIRQYIYLYAVTFKLNFLSILRNCVILMIAGIVNNIVSLIFNAVIIVVCFLLHPLVTLLALPFIFYSFIGFQTIFTVYPVLKRIYLDPALEKEAKENPEMEIIEDEEVE
jgi:hypothetical protein